MPLEGIAPSLESISNGSYLLGRDLALLAPVQPAPEVAQFIEFCLSPAGQGAVKESLTFFNITLTNL